MNRVFVDMPALADGELLEVIELLVAKGETVSRGQPLLSVESSSRAMELPSPHGGVVASVLVQLGDRVAAGKQLLMLDTVESVYAPAAQRNDVPVRVPDIGDFDAVTVVEVMVKAGDVVALDQGAITVESDKASMEIPSPEAGVVKEVLVKVGDKVSTGSPFLVLQGRVDAPSSDELLAPTSLTEPAVSILALSPVERERVAATFASPSVRHLARVRGVPIEELQGTGPKGRITHDDVQAFTKSVMSGALQIQAQAAKAPAGGGGGGAGLDFLPWPKVDFSKFGTVERKDLSRIKKISGANLHRNWVMIPHVTNNDEADITELEAFRVSTNKENEKSGVKVTMLAFVIKAVVAALRKFPEFNTSLDGDALVYKQYFNIGFAADTPNGLVVPVLKDADKKGIIQISQEMGELAKKARDGKLGAADMQGGCFSISSLGGIGGTNFTPIINAPEVAILGLSKGQMKPVWDGKQFVPRLVLPLSLSYDHRVIDGASAARFNACLGPLLTDYRRIVL